MRVPAPKEIRSEQMPIRGVQRFALAFLSVGFHALEQPDALGVEPPHYVGGPVLASVVDHHDREVAPRDIEESRRSAAALADLSGQLNQLVSRFRY